VLAVSERQAEPALNLLEERVRTWLEGQGVEFLVKPRLRVEVFGRKRRLEPDFLVPAENLIIEVNGCWVHGCRECFGHNDGHGRHEMKRYKDDVRERALRLAGYEVETIWEHELEALGS